MAVRKVAKKVAKKTGKLMLRRRNGKLEEFSKKRVHEALKLAGTATKEAGEIAEKTALFAKRKAKQGVITAIELERTAVSLLVEKNKQITEQFKKATKKW